MNQKKDGQINKLRYCVMICESLNPNYDSSSVFREIGNFSAIDYTLNWLSENNIEEVFMFYSNLKNEIQEYCQTIVKGIDLKLKLNYMKPTQMKSFGDVMREVRFRDLVSQDFLVVYADMITNVNISKTIAFHFDKKIQLRNVVLTSVMSKGLTSELMIINSNTSQILQIKESGKEFSLNTEKVNLKKLNVQFRRDLIHSDIFICTVEVLKAFKQNQEHQTIHDFILGMLTSEVYQQKILSYQLESKEVAFRINKASNLYLSYMNFICGYLYPYSLHSDHRMSKIQRSVEDKPFTVKKYNRFFRKGVKVTDTTVLSNNIYLGENARIEGQCKIQKSIIGKNVVVGRNTVLKQCIVLEDVKIAPSSHFEYCLLEKTGTTVKITSFKPELYQGPIGLIDKSLFQQTPEPQKVVFQEETKHLLDEKNEDETITVSELVRIRMMFQKSEADLTKQIIKIIAPKGIKGIESLTESWGTILYKVHHDDEEQLMDSLFYACKALGDYQKAFHLFLQYFYHDDILNKKNIIEWIKSTPDDSLTLKLCIPFLEKLQAESEDQQDDEDEDN